jgi:hypothetical protein
MFRLFAALLVFLLAGPSLLFQQTRRPVVTSQVLTATRLSLPVTRFGPLEVLEAWQLASPHDGFGGVSAMALMGDRRFLLLSDAGMVMRFHLSPQGQPSDIAIVPLGAMQRRKTASDVESLWRDPVSGRVWVGFEGSNRIARFAADGLAIEAQARPIDMRRWRSNGGAEAMVRLADGRWLILAEKARTRRLGTAALLFAGDPTEPATPPPLRFGYRDWGMGSLTDATMLPDGRVLLLHRDVDPWRWFTTTVAIGEPASIRAQQPWTARPLAAIGWPNLSENFEAMTVAPHPRGVSIWLASDDNFSPWQRTLLLHLLLPTGRMPPR